MSPDREDCSLDDTALSHAGINPMTCRNSVQCAIKRELPGCYEAEAYLMQLYEQVEAGILKPTRIVKPPPGVIGTDDIYISKEDAERWRPEAPPIQPANNKPKPSNPSGDLTGKSKTTHQQTIIGLVEYVIWNETGKPKPKHFEDRDIVLSNGRLSAEALRELLQAMYPDTPNRAEEIIKEALKLKVPKLDD